MTGAFLQRRRAEHFDAVISRPAGQLTEQDAGAFADLLGLVHDLRSIPQVQARPEFVGSLRTRLLAEADVALLPQSQRPLTEQEQRLVLPVRPRRSDRRAAVVLASAALVGASGSMAMAAQTALPGESLYPVKRVIEDARTDLAADEAARGRSLLAQARVRLDELDSLAERGDPASVSAIGSTIETFAIQSTEGSRALLAAYGEGGDAEAVTGLRAFAGDSIERLGTLEPRLPVSSRDALVDAGQRLVDIDQRAQQLCLSCGGDAVELPDNLLAVDMPGAGVRTVIVTASQSPRLLEPRPTGVERPEPAAGPDLPDIEVPELEVPDPTRDPTKSPGATPTPTTKPSSPVKVDVKKPVDDVTKVLTGNLDDLVGDVPGVGDTLTGLGGVVDDTTTGLQGTLDQTTGSLLP